MRWLYKYPQTAFPYAELVAENRRRGKREPEYELLDTGVFDDDRYFDVFVEYAKASPEDVLIADHRRSIAARTSRRCELLPTIWFRNTWSWGVPGHDAAPAGRVWPVRGRRPRRAEVRPKRWLLTAKAAPRLLFTENETNARRLFGAPDSVAVTSRTASTTTSSTATRRPSTPRAPAPRPRPSTR